MKRIAIVRLSSFGDLIHTIPAVRSLRTHFPQARLVWFVEKPGDLLLRCFQGIDEIVPLQMRRQRIIPIWKQMKHQKKIWSSGFDAIIDFQGLLKSALFARNLKGDHLGFHRKNLREPLALWFYNRRADFFPESHHIIRKNLHLLTLLGINDSDTSYLPLSVSPSPSIRSFFDSTRFPYKKWVALNIGGGWPTKLLPISHWHTILSQIQNLQALLLWGNEEEHKTALLLSQKTGIPIAPFLDFPNLFWVLQQARLLVSADTLALHAADVVRTPSIGLFGPTFPERNGSLLKESRTIQSNIPCRFCYKRKCDTIQCMFEMDVDSIVFNIHQIYERP